MTEQTRKEVDNKPAGRLSDLSDIVSLPNWQIDDDEFTKLFDGKEDEAIEAMVDAGWELGSRADGQNEYWPPAN